MHKKSDCWTEIGVPPNLNDSIVLSSRTSALPNCTKQDLLRSLDRPSLAWRRRRAKVIYFWSLMNSRGPPNLSKCIPNAISDRCSYQLRNSKSVQFPLCSSAARLSSFIPSSIALWNSLPVNVSSESSLSSFTSSLDSHFAADRFTFGFPP